ncbi:NlpC/P60 family protein [Bacillus sp. CGMCC 1.16541]|uniref:C40 family peptidase n=1 Tax=Bacillus sp. CGMCC 1.16541 TaxID=2185143 RepID=UPI000D734EDC|nr:NlpC/P60 family protein [Bacillus sp. CGMCC 1.16541]
MKKVVTTLAMTGAMFAAPNVGQAALGDDVLKQGMQSSDVTELKELLKKKGHLDQPVSNYFNYDTVLAVKDFQKTNNLKADGIVGHYTYKALNVPSKDVKSEIGYNVNQLIADAKNHIDTPYKWGGTSPSGFDCSGFLQYVFKNSVGVDLPRTVEQMYNAGKSVSEPSVGDLVYFETYKPGASHAGIYLGEGKFIHTSTSKGVTISDKNSSYWSERYLGAKKVVID